jgi:DOPA 4,5-dioxygenase
MSTAQYPVNDHQHYHAHLYYDEVSWPIAEKILLTIEDKMEYKVGRRHKKCVGPHPMWSCQISFDSQSFDGLIPWLDKHREGLSVLVHPITIDDLIDHTKLACWLGQPVALRLKMFQ